MNSKTSGKIGTEENTTVYFLYDTSNTVCSDVEILTPTSFVNCGLLFYKFRRLSNVGHSYLHQVGALALQKLISGNFVALFCVN